MFTGIIQAIGIIKNIQYTDLDAKLSIQTPQDFLAGVQLGDSIAVNGVCLTVTKLDNIIFMADISQESLQRTTFNQLKTGDKVNLEPALTPQTSLGGHIVTGHVDGVGILLEKINVGLSTKLIIQAPSILAKYIAEKGSICIDGVSLTVNTVTVTKFELNIVPHTLATTTLGNLKSGQALNLEVDIIARYLERLLLAGAVPKAEILTEQFLQQHGFIS